MMSVVKVAKTVREATNYALEELNVEESDVRVEILEEPSKGLFGLLGTKDAVVKVTIVNDPVETIKTILSKVLTSMKVIGNVRVEKDGSCLRVEIIDINSSDMGIVIGKRGNTLDAIQYLLSLIINKNRESYIKIIVDIKGYRKKREETLIRLANRMAEKSKYNRIPIKLEPMNPYERRIIHSALQNVHGVATFSEGEEPYRRVIIQAK